MSDAEDPLLDDDTPDDPVTVERRIDELLAAAFAGRGEIFANEDAAHLAVSKKAADRLVELKLARFSGEGRTRVEVTNAGRYWALNGGYMGFLKEIPPGGGGGGGRNQNPEFQALRMNYMKLRLNTFWLSFGLSIAGFIISMISLAVAALTGQTFFHR
ncbi:hypothetical protein IZ6_23220 [Terrihabitans soli]|uniref:Uncharacterized protein n=1 Tax=Terrihabitans soli TaxID=708113 RepID=A0A6S6QUI4_9HYPH|nr:hypothetical protein [Terrihabitans soli]BCJ91587.1 hypothetical protein IZ6_23220 [Terrihabitans soli]